MNRSKTTWTYLHPIFFIFQNVAFRTLNERPSLFQWFHVKTYWYLYCRIIFMSVNSWVTWKLAYFMSRRKSQRKLFHRILPVNKIISKWCCNHILSFRISQTPILQNIHYFDIIGHWKFSWNMQWKSVEIQLGQNITKSNVKWNCAIMLETHNFTIIENSDL